MNVLLVQQSSVIQEACQSHMIYEGVVSYKLNKLRRIMNMLRFKLYLESLDVFVLLMETAPITCINRITSTLVFGLND